MSKTSTPHSRTRSSAITERMVSNRKPIGEALLAIRTAKGFSQGEVEKRTGLSRCYLSRVENGHTIPSLGTLDKLAKAFEIEVYQFFYQGDKPQTAPPIIVTREKLSQTRLCSALLEAFNQAREGGSVVPFFNEIELATMAQSMQDSLGCALLGKHLGSMTDPLYNSIAKLMPGDKRLVRQLIKSFTKAVR